MNSEDAKRWQLIERYERARDGKLPPEEEAELEACLQADPELRLFFARSLLLDAELRFDPHLVQDPEINENVVESQKSRLRSNIIPMTLLAAAACVMITVGIRTFVKEIPLSPIHATVPTVATITKSQGCRWGSSTLPTAEGSRISAGTFELVEGLATLQFDSGAEVVLEAPATLEIIDSMNCRLMRGTVVADVPPQAIGFTVDTKDAKIVDLGTRFGVSADEDGKYLVHVIEGLVEVAHKGEDTIKKVTPERLLDRGLLKRQLSPSSDNIDEANRWQPDVIVSDSQGWQTISTNYGSGRDSFVQPTKAPRNFGGDPFMRVKNTTLNAGLLRKGYVAFDLSKFDLSEIDEAEFSLSVEPSDLGFATLVPDSVFHVYGLTDEAGDSWNEKTITWQNAPATYDGDPKLRHLPDPAKTVLLGTFVVPQGTSRGSFSIQGEALVEFLKADTNGIATLIISRETDETAHNGLVHAFATRENRGNTPPLLRVKLTE